ncbi:prevent-host-death protein [Candidatus Peregrinibacteria bacterium]|nr:MAG: prevent-host-death protein [Candidatus Peregrinibacteria bacterium]
MIITANYLKERGASAIKESLQDASEVYISVRGKETYVVTSVEQYDEFREYQLEKALNETLLEVKEGDYKQCSVQDHIKDIADAL